MSFTSCKSGSNDCSVFFHTICLNMERYTAPCMQDLETSLFLNLRFHPNEAHAWCNEWMNAEDHNHETVSAATAACRCTSRRFRMRRTWVCESEPSIGGALNSHNSSVVFVCVCVCRKSRSLPKRQHDIIWASQHICCYCSSHAETPNPDPSLAFSTGGQMATPSNVRTCAKIHTHAKAFVILSFVRTFNWHNY